jgi:hypothetical protein
MFHNKLRPISLAMILFSLILLTACTAVPAATTEDFTEISIADVQQKIGNLQVDIYSYDPKTTEEGGYFKPVGLSFKDLMAKHEAERQKPFSHDSLTLNGQKLTMSFDTSASFGKGVVLVQLDGKTVFSKPYGDETPVSPLQGLFVIDDKWAFEMVHINSHTESNVTEIETTGEVIIDGKSMNELYGYSESFGLQSLAGKLFYLYEKDGKIGLFLDGYHVATGFTSVPHYGCCSASAFNPRHYQNMIDFFASKDKESSFVEIGVSE